MIQPLKDYPEFYPELPGWKFDIDEVSANVYAVVVTHESGRQVSTKGFETELDELVEQCKRFAKTFDDISARVDD